MVQMGGIVLFDGECHFCNKSVQFIYKRDPQEYFQFAHRHSKIGKKLMKQYGIDETIDSLIFIEEEKFYLRSTAALKICKNLQGMWKCFYIFILVPKPIRDYCYKIIAKNRYRWLGKNDPCFLPPPDFRKRFLE